MPIQRFHQKQIEEALSPLISDANPPRHMSRPWHWPGPFQCAPEAGTVPVVGKDQGFYSPEMNNLPVVEHPVMECITGLTRNR